MRTPISEDVKTGIKKMASSLNTYVKSQNISDFLEIEAYLKYFFEAYEVKFWHYDENNKTLTLQSTEDADTLPLTSSLTEQAIITKSPLRANHVTSNKFYNHDIDNPMDYKIKALLVFPMLKGKSVIGVLRIWRGLKQKKSFVKKDEENLMLFMPLFLDILESKSIIKEDLLRLLDEKEVTQKKSVSEIVVNKQNTNAKKRESQTNDAEVEALKEKLDVLEKENKEIDRRLKSELRCSEDDLLKEEEKVVKAQKELENFEKKYTELEKSSMEIYKESQQYQTTINELEKDLTLLKSENKTFQKELKKEKENASTLSIKKLKSEKSLAATSNLSDIDQNIEFILQKVDERFADNEHTYMLFELIVYALSSKKGTETIEESVRKSKLLQTLIDNYYFKGDIEIHNEKCRVSDMVEHIKSYEKSIFANMIKLEINFDKSIPASLVLDAPKIQSVILHLLLDLHQFVDHHQPIRVDFIFKKKFLSIELGGHIHKKNSLFQSMFKQTKLGGDEKDRIGLRLSKKVMTRLKGNIDYLYEDAYYKFIVTVPTQVIKM